MNVDDARLIWGDDELAKWVKDVNSRARPTILPYHRGPRLT